MTKEELTRRILAASGMIKLTLGVVNTCAWLVTLEAHDNIRKSPRYKHQIKQAFKAVLQEHKAYEDRLLYATTNRFFCVADMTENTRKKFGKDFTDQQYFEFWKGIGGPAFNRTRPLVTSLWNKYRKSLLAHGQKEADASAWAFTAIAALRMSDTLHTRFIENCPEEYGIDKRIATNIFNQFSMKRVLDAWVKATKMFADTAFYPLDASEDRHELQQQIYMEQGQHDRMMREAFTKGMRLQRNPINSLRERDMFNVEDMVAAYKQIIAKCLTGFSSAERDYIRRVCMMAYWRVVERHKKQGNLTT